MRSKRLAPWWVLLTVPTLTTVVMIHGGGVSLAEDRLDVGSSSLVRAVERADRAGGEWLSYEVPVVAGQRALCCFDAGRLHDRPGQSGKGPSSCRLDQEDGGWGSSSEAPLASALEVYLRVEQGRVDRILAVARECLVEARGQKVTRLASIDANESAAFLAELARDRGRSRHETRGDLADRALAALAYHGVAAADDQLRELATSAEHSAELREQAVFWIGQARGRRGFETLRALLASERSADQREKIIFSLSQTDEPEAPEVIRRTATGDSSEEVRAQALFWLAQSGSPRAAEWILEAVARDRSKMVRHQGVFALSQLPGEDAIRHLSALLRTSKDRDVRQQALFWLAQEDDPRALDVVAKILE